MRISRGAHGSVQCVALGLIPAVTLRSGGAVDQLWGVESGVYSYVLLTVTHSQLVLLVSLSLVFIDEFRSTFVH